VLITNNTKINISQLKGEEAKTFYRNTIQIMKMDCSYCMKNLDIDEAWEQVWVNRLKSDLTVAKEVLQAINMPEAIRKRDSQFFNKLLFELYSTAKKYGLEYDNAKIANRMLIAFSSTIDPDDLDGHDVLGGEVRFKISLAEDTTSLFNYLKGVYQEAIDIVCEKIKDDNFAKLDSADTVLASCLKTLYCVGKEFNEITKLDVFTPDWLNDLKNTQTYKDCPVLDLEFIKGLSFLGGLDE
jgi:hypothetical protein